VAFHELDGDASTVTMATDYTSVAHKTDAPNIDLIDDVCQTYGVTLNRFYAHAASRHTEANKERHKHWKPPKGSTLPASDIHHMMADKTNIDINGVKYLIKKADSAAQHSDITIEELPILSAWRLLPIMSLHHTY